MIGSDNYETPLFKQMGVFPYLSMSSPVFDYRFHIVNSFCTLVVEH